MTGLVAYCIIGTCNFVMNDAELVSNLISLFVCLGTLISATFIVYSYMQTNKAFMLSQKPFLLIQVVSEHLQPDPQAQPIPFTIIHYTNTSQNEFVDLTIFVKIHVSNRVVDISDLFRTKMFMAAHDQRNRRFETLSFLSTRGLDINAETASGNQVILSTHYTFNFSNKLEMRQGPEYKWNSQIKHWEIA